MICKKCGKEIDKKTVVCVNCGCKIKAPIYKKWWFWLIIVLAIIIIGGASSGNNGELKDTSNNVTTNASQETESFSTTASQEKINYEVVDLQTMFDDLDANAMKAESNYQDKYVEMKCKIKSYDSDGAYISVEPINADEWNFTTAMCYIKNDTQKQFLLEKNVGDKIAVKGQITSIGEVLGYSIDIDEVY